MEQLTEHLEVKVCDFGSTCKLEKGALLEDGLGKGTTPYLAPEVLRQERYDHAIDVYSLGVMMWTLVTGRMPFDDIISSVGIIVAITGGDWFEFPFQCLDGSPLGPEVVMLISRCLDVQSKARPSADELAISLAHLKNTPTQE